MRKQIYIDGKKDISEILNKRAADKNTIVGELPPFIFNALPKENRKNAIREIIDEFAEVAEQIRQFRGSDALDNNEYINKRSQKSVEQLKQVLLKYNLLKEPEKFDIKYLDSGAYKKAYVIEGLGNDTERLAFKVFHIVDETPEWHKYKSHGNYAELNINAYWKDKEGVNTQRGVFYFGDIKKGYFVDKFIDEKTPPPKRDILEYDRGLKPTDEFVGAYGHNKINQYSIDPGGLRVINRTKNGNPVSQYVFKRIKFAPENERVIEWEKIFATHKNIDKDSKLAGLAIGIKYLPNKMPYVKRCFDWNIPLVDKGLAYSLKYLSVTDATKFFEKLMKRKNPITQVVLLNEIPLLAKTECALYDDLDVAKKKINSDLIEIYYKIAEKYVLPEAAEHLASYVHLLPKPKIMKEYDKLIDKKDYHTQDRILHKMQFLKDEELPNSLRFEVLDKLEKTAKHPFIREKIQRVRVTIIRNSLADD